MRIYANLIGIEREKQQILPVFESNPHYGKYKKIKMPGQL